MSSRAEGEAAAQATVQAYTYRILQRTADTGRSKDDADQRPRRIPALLARTRRILRQRDEQSMSRTTSPSATVDVSQTRGGRGGRGGGAALQILTSALGERGSPIVQAFGGATNPPVFYPGTMDPDGAVPISVAASVEVRGMDFNLRPITDRNREWTCRRSLSSQSGKRQCRRGRGRGANLPDGGPATDRIWRSSTGSTQPEPCWGLANRTCRAPEPQARFHAGQRRRFLRNEKCRARRVQPHGNREGPERAAIHGENAGQCWHCRRHECYGRCAARR